MSPLRPSLALASLLLPLAACAGGDDGRETGASATATTGVSTASATATTTAATDASVGTESGTTTGSASASTTGTSAATTDVSTSASTSAGVADLGPDLDLPKEECVSSMLEPELQSVGVDVIIVVDTSNSMAAAINSVEQSINQDFAAILEMSMIDYRVIVLGDYPPGGQLDICITAPLSATDCNPPPPVPAITERYKHYDAITGSGAFLDNILAWYKTPDPHGLAPGGYVDFLRDDSRKVFLAMTDGGSASGNAGLGDQFDQKLLTLDPPHFGIPGDRRYLFHTIIQMPENMPATEPWMADDPIAGQGGSIQQVSILTEGWRFPLSQAANFDVVFKEIAKDVVNTTPIACEFPIPEAPMGETIDPNTIEIDFFPEGMMDPISFHQVVNADACEPEAFYIDNETVILCPETCTQVQSDLNASMEVRYGCDVGFIPG
ncbi:MAG: hypothetical protein R3B09_20015 [Nannocystaceae bacterium]